MRSAVGIWGISIASGLLVFLTATLVHWIVYNLWLGLEGTRVVGAGVAAVVMILLIQRQLTEQRKERLAALRRFELIAEMNHHIRNALQTISYQRYTDTDPAASQRLKEAVERIQWVLEEILPDVQKQ